ncbi:protease m50 membrane-bound transcription factor site 2 protease [Anaeramoeba flamelloides]|uniref:Endopeptidase S2P n=1 Tax=Anaeramoeba flamelloides TaxID=1746091 RepID=A0AAV7ZRB3_9EUKA|nr:protease m50 membrane-bound transcription factor site 2 protease [Anaeramoeba flamelloides]KAJ6251256.1 protease m50 membrane-bound transcription factor site 2 protease [Anaeramoeba flamelloides]
MKIYSAGIWHNCIIFIITLIIIFFLPRIILTFYETNQGIAIISSNQSSELGQKLNIGETITSVNSCKTTNFIDFFNCFEDISKNLEDNRQILNYCVNKTIIDEPIQINQLSTSEQTYKSTMNNYNNLLTCFQNEELEINYFPNIQICLNQIDALLNSNLNSCKSKHDCYQPIENINDCLLEIQNTDKIHLNLEISNEKNVQYYDSFELFFQVIELGEFFFKMKIANNLSFVLRIPSLLDLFFKYLITISGGLIVLNVTPCYFSDGGHLIKTILSKFFKHNFSKAIIAGGTCLIIVNIILSLYGLKFSSQFE